MTEEEIIIQFSVTPEIAQGIVDEIAEARGDNEEEWSFKGTFELDNAIEIQAQLQKQLQDVEMSQRFDSYES